MAATGEAAIAQLVAQLTQKDSRAACDAMRALERESAVSAAVYPHLDDLVLLLADNNSLVRNRALCLIAANAHWDTEGRLDGIIGSYLAHIGDEKPITARQCIQGLPQIAQHRPQLKNRILTALRSADTDRYADSMRPLVEKDIQTAIRTIENSD